ncbi:septum site-determining protein MinC [Butyrivibrio sp. Su6]|uniref:septum site-determining protein MinC n=1 Tax=Butyrivibrio sp. Su6 TaxID=1520810 RepID=UPI00089E89C6|nr:septum site-determining protein MinC [Butyrivibrio sp. Su6]SEF44351.1 septum site-determining protein MinC [Butyrivibrio sp. Su6]
MNQAVTIKGTKSGIILVLDNETPFEELKVETAERFEEASGFLGHNSMGLIVRGRRLSEKEEKEIVDIITEHSQLKIVCVIDEESEEERLFKSVNTKDIGPSQKSETDEMATPEHIVQDYNNNALIYNGNLRSGQDISCEQSVVILGDVKPGASVVSYGSIFILGELRGNAFAGAGGDRGAFVMALDLNPLQVRIADSIAISPDAEKGPKLRLKKKKLLASAENNEPEVAYIENGHIVKSLYGPAFLRQLNK